jgi:mRNA interferase MazF
VLSAVTRGDIVVFADRSGQFGGKPRPAVVLQAALFGESVPVPICPITSRSTDTPLLRIALSADATTGLEAPSWAMIDGLTTVRPQRIGQLIGNVDDTTMLAIGRALIVFLGLA